MTAAGYTLTSPDHSQTTFAAGTGRLTSSKDANGRLLTLAYNTAAPPQLVTVTDATSGRALHLARTGSQPSSVSWTDPAVSPPRPHGLTQPRPLPALPRGRGRETSPEGGREQPHTPLGYTYAVKPSYTKDRDALLTRLSRIEGQVRGVSRMVDEEAYCIDVLTQINAIKAAIDQVGLLLLEDHIKGCVTSAVRQGDQSKVEELVKAVERFAKA